MPLRGLLGPPQGEIRSGASSDYGLGRDPQDEPTLELPLDLLQAVTATNRSDTPRKVAGALATLLLA